MNDNKILFTPSNIFSGVDLSVSGDITVLSEKREDGLLQREMFFPAGPQGEKPINCYAMLCTKDDAKKKPLIMVIGNSRQSVDREILAFFARQGFTAFMYDYLGEREDAAKYTFYPQEISYANYAFAGRRLKYVDDSVRDTAPYQWLLLAQRALSRALSFAETDAEAGAGVMGVGLGANTAWMLAALERRIAALCTVFSAGWYEYAGCFKYDPDCAVPEIDEERERWIAGLSVQAYARYIEAPVLYMSASNSNFTDMDRAYDTLSRVKSKDVLTYIAPGKHRIIGIEGGNNALLFFKKYLLGAEIDITGYQNTQITLHLTDKKQPMPYATTADDIDTDKATPEYEAAVFCPYIVISGLDGTQKNTQVYYSCDQPNPGSRYFYSAKPQTATEQDCNNLPEEVFNLNITGRETLVISYAVIEYKSGFVLSPMPAVLHRPECGEPSAEPLRRNPVIYNSQMGTTGFAAFVPEKPSFSQILLGRDGGGIKIKAGAGGIKGILCKNGGIATYKISVAHYSGEEEESLKFDVYSQQAQQLCVYGLDRAGYEEEHYHFSSIQLLGGEMWQPVEIKKSSLKTAEGQPVKSWKDISMIGFYCEREALINNLLWF